MAWVLSREMGDGSRWFLNQPSYREHGTWGARVPDGPRFASEVEARRWAVAVGFPIGPDGVEPFELAGLSTDEGVI